MNASIASLSVIHFPCIAQSGELTTEVNGLPKSSDAINNAPKGFYKNRLLEVISDQHWKLVEDFRMKSINPSKTKLLTLKECINFAFADNPEIKQQLSQLESTRDLLVASTRTWNPSASISSETLSISRGEQFLDQRVEQRSSQADQLGSITRTRTTETTTSRANTNLQAAVQWDFLDFTRQPTINSSSAAYAAQRYTFYVFARDLVNEIQTTYYQLLAQKDLIDSYIIIAQSLKNTAEVQQAQFEAGRVNLQDLGQSYASYYNALSTLIQSIQTYYQFSSTMARLVSLPEETFIITNQNHKFQGEWEYGLEESIDLARLNNDRVLVAMERSKEARWSGISELKRTLPTLYLQARANYLGTDQSLETSQDTELVETGGIGQSSSQYLTSSQWSRVSNYDLSALIGFRWDFYQGGVNSARAASAFNRSKALEFEAEANRNLVTERVRSTINALTSNMLEFTTAKAAAESSKIAYVAAMARLNAGLSDITSLNQLATQYQQAITIKIRSIQDYNIRLANLYRETAIWPQDAEGLADHLLESTGLQ